jgi:hypothetical protein
MSNFLRSLLLAGLTTATVLQFSSCSKTAEPTPQAQAQTGALVGQVSPANALASVTATPVGGGTAYTATISSSGSYAFVSLPVGNYTIVYTAAAGFINPAAQTASVTVNSTFTLPAVSPQGTRLTLLTDKNWIITAATISPGVNIGGTIITDFYGQYQPCDKDDFIRFERPSVFKSDEGATKCNMTSPQTTTGTWVFNSDQTIVTVTEQGGAPVSINILELTDSTLRISFSQVSAGISYNQTNTYRKG